MTYTPGQENDPLFNALKTALTGDTAEGRYARGVLGEEAGILDEAALSASDAKAVMQHLHDISKVLKTWRKLESGYQTSKLQAMLNMLGDMTAKSSGLNPGMVRALEQARDELQRAFGMTEHAYKRISQVHGLLTK